MSLKVGIDLGTTYSAVSYYDNGKVETLELDAGGGTKLVPSVVYYEAATTPPIVGTTALNAFVNKPELVVRGIKKHMGTDATTDEIHGRRYSPQEVSTEILRALTSQAEVATGEPVKDVVITVPAYFGDRERNATSEAANNAGLNLLGLISEPHAAALAYSLESAGDIRTPYILVYDLGGGTFDVTLIRAVESSDAERIVIDVETLAKDGKRVGGLDWDRAIFDHVALQAQKRFQRDLRSDLRVEAEVLLECEKAKRVLSTAEKAQIRAGSVTEQIELSREEFEQITESLLLQTKLLLEKVLNDVTEKGIGRDEITVVLVGGMTRMPAVGAMIEHTIGKPPLKYKNPDLLVTIGAAYYAHLLSHDKVAVRKPGQVQRKEVTLGKLVDIARQAVGVEVLRKGESYNSHVIPPGSVFGTEFKRTFAVADDGATEVDVVLYEGPETRDPSSAAECSHLVTCKITGLPPDRPKGAPIEVTLWWDDNGILVGRATDVQTSKAAQILLDRRAQPAAQALV
jgi:molecular chaperone DnaK